MLMAYSPVASRSEFFSVGLLPSSGSLRQRTRWFCSCVCRRRAGRAEACEPSGLSSATRLGGVARSYRREQARPACPQFFLPVAVRRPPVSSLGCERPAFERLVGFKRHLQGWVARARSEKRIRRLMVGHEASGRSARRGLDKFCPRSSELKERLSHATDGTAAGSDSGIGCLTICRKYAPLRFSNSAANFASAAPRWL